MQPPSSITVCGLWLVLVGEFKKKDKLAKPKPSHKGTVIYRLKPFKNQVRPTTLAALGGGLLF